jgi:hypothetical protein
MAKCPDLLFVTKMNTGWTKHTPEDDNVGINLDIKRMSRAPTSSPSYIWVSRPQSGFI